MNELLAGLILFSSFSMRTPNDTSIPKDDYEVSIGFKNKSEIGNESWVRTILMTKCGSSGNQKTFTSNHNI